MNYICSLVILLPLLWGCGTENNPTFKLNTTVSPVGSGIILPTQTTFEKGEIAILEAMPANGWRFIRWEGDLTSTDNPVNLGMMRDHNIIGIFERVDYSLTLTVEGQGSITERLVIAKTTDYPFQTIVELTPVPAEGWAFKAWNGDLTGSQSPAMITLTGPKSVMARFVTSPSVSTGTMSDLSATGAMLSGYVISDGSDPVTARGVCYAITQNPTTANTCVASGSGTGAFSSILTGLTQQTQYFSRAYATNSVGTAYGASVDFTTTRSATASVSDIDGNSYPTVQIGTQLWMAANLKTTRYQDGSAIPNVTDEAMWSLLTTGAWVNYANDSTYDAIYGKLYNWYAVEDNRNLCPTGWHVPSDAEWTILSDFLGADVGHKMKSNPGWVNNGNGSNASGFTGLPSGYRSIGGIYSYAGKLGYFWSSPVANAGLAWFRLLMDDFNGLLRDYTGKRTGFPVRCLRN